MTCVHGAPFLCRRCEAGPMKSDDRGDAGFMEAMVAFMAVSVVLATFLGAVATTAISTADPTSTLDPGGFSGTIEDGVFVEGFTGYLSVFVDSNSLRGATVYVTIPGGFCGTPEPVTIGEMDGALYSRTLAGTVTDGFGRVLPAVFEVILCARRRGGSWR